MKKISLSLVVAVALAIAAPAGQSQTQTAQPAAGASPQTATPAQPGSQQPGAPAGSQPAAGAQAGAAPQQKKEIKDPAEYNAYVSAVQQSDPNAKVSGLEAFLQQRDEGGRAGTADGDLPADQQRAEDD